MIGQIDIIPKGIINFVIKGKSKIYFMPAEGYGFDSEYDIMYPDDYTYDHLNYESRKSILFDQFFLTFLYSVDFILSKII